MEAGMTIGIGSIIGAVVIVGIVLTHFNRGK
jgi:hypothetical protein